MTRTDYLSPAVDTLNAPMPDPPELPAKCGGAKGVLLAPILKLAQQKYYWSPVRFPRLVWTMARNIRTHLRVHQVLSRPAYRRLIEVNPRFPLKFWALDYLARGLTVAQQAECFIHHYRRLTDLLPENMLTQILFEDILLDEIRTDNDCFCIKLGLSRPEDREGELSLSFEVNGELVTILSFSIIPGWIVQSEAREVILVSRVQGVRGAFDQIQRATKAMADIVPSRILFAALVGFAEAFEIKAVAGINATMRPEFYYPGEARHIQQAYDEFFAELGATRGPSGFYLGPLPLPEKPLAAIKLGHKIRTKRKRSFRLEISQRVHLFFVGSANLGRTRTGKKIEPQTRAN